jgi:uncharacterized protein YjeT (DUF2065 family)
MIASLTFAVVLLAGLYLVSLAAVALASPPHAARFLLGFAATARLHYCELALRGLAGGAFVLQAPHMRFGSAFAVAGWGLLLTTAVLTLVPWRWHRAFAQRAVPYAVRHLRAVGAASLVLGALVLVAALTGGST